MAGGTAASQVILMLFSPLTTRLYGPEAYGMQGVFFSIVALTSTVAALSYPSAIALPRSDAEAWALARLSIAISLLVSCLVGVVLFFRAEGALVALHADAIQPVIALLPVAIFATVVCGVTGAWLMRRKAFAVVAKASVLTALTINLMKVGVGALYPIAAILVIANVAANVLRTALMLWGMRKSTPSESAAPIEEESRLGAWQLAGKYGDFALLRTPQTFINALSASLPIMMLASYFGPVSVGYYALANTVLGIPGAMIGGSVMQVFYPRVNEAFHRGENIRELIVKATLGLAFAGAIPLAAVLIAGPTLFSVVFGAGWEQAGVYAQWLSVWLFFQYVNKPAVSAIPALKLQKGLLFYELFSTGSKIFALWLGFIIYESDIAAIALFSVFGVIAYLWLILWVIHHADMVQVRVCPIGN